MDTHLSSVEILIVDDDERVLGATAGQFAYHGYQVHSAQSAEAARGILTQHNTIGLALIDIKLQDGPDAGIELVRYLRADHAGVRIIVYSGGVSSAVRRKAMQEGAMFFIDKSTPEQLVYAARAVAEMWLLEAQISNFRLTSERMQNVFESIGGEVLVRDADHKIIQINAAKRKAYQKRHGFSDRELADKVDAMIGTVTDLDFSRGSPYPAKDTSQLGTYTEWPTIDGSTLSVISNEIHDETGKLLGYVSLSKDISRRKLIRSLQERIEKEVADAEKYPEFKDVCQLIVDAFAEYTKGRVRIYLIGDDGAKPMATSGMDGQEELMFRKRFLESSDDGIRRAFRSRDVIAVRDWDHRYDQELGVQHATEKIFVPVVHPHSQAKFCLVTLDNEHNPGRTATPEDLDLLGLFRTSVENVLWIALCRERERAELKWLEAFAKVDEILIDSAEEDAEVVFRRVGKILWKTIGAKSASFYRCLPDGRMQDIFRFGGVPIRQMNPFEPQPESKKNLAKAENRVILISDAKSDPGSVALLKGVSDEIREFHKDTYSKIIIPFAIGNDVLALGVMHFAAPTSSVTADDLQRINLMQRRVAIALARVKQHEAIRRKAIRQTEQAHLGLMTAGFGHSLKNSIQTCYSYVNDLQRAALPEHANALIGKMERRLDELNDRINDIRKFVLPAEREHGSAKVGVILKQLIELFELNARVEEIRIEACYPEPDVEVASREGLVRMVLVDLLQNALNVSPKGGMLRIAAELDGNKVRLTVEDSGPGLPEEILHAVNNPAKVPPDASPLGLGLHLAVIMIPEIGGNFSARNKSSPASGAVFTITLPLAGNNHSMDHE